MKNRASIRQRAPHTARTFRVRKTARLANAPSPTITSRRDGNQRAFRRRPHITFSGTVWCRRCLLALARSEGHRTVWFCLFLVCLVFLGLASTSFVCLC